MLQSSQRPAQTQNEQTKNTAATNAILREAFDAISIQANTLANLFCDETPLKLAKGLKNWIAGKSLDCLTEAMK